MTKCFLTDKTYPDYAPTHDNTAITAAIYNVFSHIDFVNREQGDLAMQCCHLILNLMNNNPEAFKDKLSAINMTAQGLTRPASELVPINTVRQPVFKQAVAEIADYALFAELEALRELDLKTYLDPIMVTDDNGDERYGDKAQERFNEHHDAVESILSEYVEVSDENA